MFYSGHVAKTCFCWEVGQLFFNFGHQVSLAITLCFFYKKNFPGQTDWFDECLFPPGWICQNPLAWPPLSRSSPLSEKRFFLRTTGKLAKQIDLIFFQGSWKKTNKKNHHRILSSLEYPNLGGPCYCARDDPSKPAVTESLGKSYFGPDQHFDGDKFYLWWRWLPDLLFCFSNSNKIILLNLM